MREGAKILMQVLGPEGFSFRIVRTGPSSGGKYCQAELSCGHRKIKLHYRWSLGLVRYCIGNQSTSHTAYVTALGIEGDSQFPGFPEDDPMAAFRNLACDLYLIVADFLAGNGKVLAQAAAAEENENRIRQRQLLIQSVGDTRRRSKAREAFRIKNYIAVVKLLEELEYPDDMTPAELKMLAIARKRLHAG